jgi:hypothetical protein
MPSKERKTSKKESAEDFRNCWRHSEPFGNIEIRLN